ncbi:MAG: site-specific DNA-methyltransferase, partial [Candidatus Electrothrix sp. EH2]|nr:site-specific DNA-methyltransferase [Candidatus Electrothrix sp. EH2]
MRRTKRKRKVEQYEHVDKDRPNNPESGIAFSAVDQEKKQYEHDPHLDPQLQWAGKAERTSFEIPTVSLHVHERVDPKRIIDQVKKEDSGPKQQSLFDFGKKPLREAVEFYKHRQNWSNRLIAGDSLLVMNSLLEKEGMAGKVQTIYFDPPYGIKYGSNFQPFVNQRNVTDGKDADLTAEPETIKAFRDTWELGIHSYLTYLRDRLLLAREMLHESGSIFVQISDENVHRVRCLLDEIFGAENFVSLIPFRKKTMPLGSKYLECMYDYLLYYAKNKETLKYHTLYEEQNVEGDFHWSWYENKKGERIKMTKEQVNNHQLLPDSARIFRLVSMWPASFSKNSVFEVEYKGKIFIPPSAQCWPTGKEGMRNIVNSGLVHVEGNNLRRIVFLDEYKYKKIVSMWGDTTGARGKQYVVETSKKVVQRCILMTSDPGDLVLDITCGSGTTAYVAEQWGRRWITCDTSRVAVTLAKQRLMTAVFDYYRLADPQQGVSGGFQYKKVPHITLKSI